MKRVKKASALRRSRKVLVIKINGKLYEWLSGNIFAQLNG